MRANHSLHAASLYGLSDALAIICGIGQKILSLSVSYKILGDTGLVVLSWGEFDVERLSQCVYECVDFR